MITSGGRKDPPAHAIQLHDVALAALANCYGRHFLDMKLIVDGINRTYRLTTDDGSFYLRLYRPLGRSLEEIGYELALVDVLAQKQDVAVSKTVRNVEGNALTRFILEGEARVGCLFTAAEGREPCLDSEDMRRLGSALAKLHNASANFKPTFLRTLDPVCIGYEAIEALRRVGPIGERIAEQVLREGIDLMTELANRRLPLGACHGDVWTGNARIENETVTFFDFDECGQGALIFDLGALPLHLRDLPDAAALWESFLSAYQVKRPLNALETASLPLCVVFHQLRILLALARFNTLTEALWETTAQRTRLTFERFRATPSVVDTR
ncbi:phosphotransferase enzyme family protein [Burkholderia glumae]